ncbi:MAG: PilZ domain-containing protein [Planctomycetota bacterium]
MDWTRAWSEQQAPHAGMRAELELRNHFSSKRDGIRVPLALEVTIRGRAGTFPARSFDVSRSGILLAITDRFYSPSGEALASFAFKVEQHFKTGADIRFVDHNFSARARVIRVTHAEHGESDLWLFACRFKSLLSDEQCEAIGLGPADEPSTTDED